MKTEEILTRVNDAMKPFEVVETANDSRDYSAESIMRDMHGKLRLLAADLEAQLRNEIAASKGAGNAQKILAAMLKAQQEKRPQLAYPWIDDKGRQCMCDGYRAYRLKNHLPLPERPENVGKGIDLNRILPSSLAGWKTLPMPSTNELKAFIATERAKIGRPNSRKNFAPIWDFGPNAPAVNALYLLDAATVFPSADKLFWNTLVSPLIITCDEGDGAVLPLRIEGKVQPAPQSDAEREAIERENAQRERNLKQERERSEIIRKAHDDFDAAQEDMRQALLRQDELRKQAKTVTDPDERNALARELVNAFEADGKARLRQYAARSVFEPDCALEPIEFAAIVKRLYARDRLSA